MEGESDVDVVSFLQTCSEALREASLMAYCGKAINLAAEIQFYYRSSYHIARKFGGLAVYIATAKLKSTKIFYSPVYVWQSCTKPPNLNLLIIIL